MLPFREISVLDRNTEALGIPTLHLMENAGTAAAEVLIDRFNLKKSVKKITFFCGLGNNGGDGFVAARILAERTKSKLKMILTGRSSEIKTDIARKNFKKIITKRTIKIIDMILNLPDLEKHITSTNIIIDSMLGVGITGSLREPYSTYVSAINTYAKRSEIPVISIDAPTGLGTKECVKPVATITFHDSKVGMTINNSGDIIIKSIGIPSEAEQFIGPGELSVYYPKPFLESHKGDNGKVLIIGGGPFTGAPALAGMAAYRTGVDLVRIATPSDAYPVVASYSPNFIVHPLSGGYLKPKDIEVILNFLPNVDCVVIGPGLGAHKSTRSAVRTILKKCTKPVLIDADGIKAAGEKRSVLTTNRSLTGVITPHLAEFMVLAGEKLPDSIPDRSEVVKKYAKKLKLTIILKGPIDIISDGTNIKLNRTGNPGMTVGGTGDVLAGIVGGLLAKGLSPYNAARVGSFVNGYSGDLAFEELKYSMLATDVIDKIPLTLNRFIN
jgi:NAD(P)H-hydrate epimerase